MHVLGVERMGFKVGLRVAFNDGGALGGIRVVVLGCVTWLFDLAVVLGR